MLDPHAHPEAVHFLQPFGPVLVDRFAAGIHPERHLEIHVHVGQFHELLLSHCEEGVHHEVDQLRLVSLDEEF